MNLESQQYVSARRRSQARVTPLARTAPKVGALRRRWQWRTAVTPAGQGEKLPSAVLLALEAGWLLRRTSALHIAASRLAVLTNISMVGY
jgi:hypothetical protein